MLFRSLFSQIKNQFSSGIGLVVYEEAPTIINKEKLLVITKNITVRTSVFVEVIVDESGEPFCSRILKSENQKMNIAALAQLQQIKFTAAKKQGQFVKSILVLSIIFDGKRSSRDKDRLKPHKIK